MPPDNPLILYIILESHPPAFRPPSLSWPKRCARRFPGFLLVSSRICTIANFIADRQDTHDMKIFLLTA